MSVKKIPMRMCTGCREMKPKKELNFKKLWNLSVLFKFSNKSCGKITSNSLISIYYPPITMQ